MLRPATPLTALLLAAFILLLLSVLSTPVIKGIPLASFNGVDFGTFGFCQGSKCSKIEIGYNTDKLFSSSQSSTFDLPSATRTTLSSILIVHPIATFFSLVMLVQAASLHFHTPSHSTRYLCMVFILSILTLLTSLLAFLVDVLLFVPHMAFGAYLVLAATILIAISGVVSCAMRRTLVGRKARKKRVEQNAEMNGENFRARTDTFNVPNTTMTTALGAEKPAFATFTKDATEERVPLTAKSPSNVSPISGPNGSPPRPGASPPSFDQYGKPIVPGRGGRDPYGRDHSAPPAPGRSRSPYYDHRVDPRARGGYRGRGNFGPNGFSPGGRGGFSGPYMSSARGGYIAPGRGGYMPPGRGGYGPPPRGNYGPASRGMGPPMRGGYGPSPRGGFGPVSNGIVGEQGVMGPGGMMRDQSAPPTYRSPIPDGNFYGRGQAPGPSYDQAGQMPAAFVAGPRTEDLPPLSQGGYMAYNPEEDARQHGFAKAESPPPLPAPVELDPAANIGKAVEMDANTGSPSHPPPGFGRQFDSMSDGEISGMVRLQQQQTQRDSDSSKYSTEEPYVPPRKVWEEGKSSPLKGTAQNAAAPKPKPLPAADEYYEDVDPRFASEPTQSSSAPSAPSATIASSSLIVPPLKLTPHNPRQAPPGGLDGDASYPDPYGGTRSPGAESDTSNFTSVSQRGVNPHWQGEGNPHMMPRRRAPPQRNDVVLNSNPDFSLPAGRGGNMVEGRSPRGMTPEGPYPGGAL